MYSKQTCQKRIRNKKEEEITALKKGPSKDIGNGSAAQAAGGLAHSNEKKKYQILRRERRQLSKVELV